MSRKKEKRGEKRAAKTTIVGGQPPGNQRDLPPIPVGMEELLSMAAVDDQFASALLQDRRRAIEASQVPLTPSEKAILTSIDNSMLDRMIACVDGLFSPTRHREFLSKAAAALLVLAGGSGVLLGGSGCGQDVPEVSSDQTAVTAQQVDDAGPQTSVDATVSSDANLQGPEVLAQSADSSTEDSETATDAGTADAVQPDTTSASDSGTAQEDPPAQKAVKTKVKQKTRPLKNLLTRGIRPLKEDPFKNLAGMTVDSRDSIDTDPFNPPPNKAIPEKLSVREQRRVIAQIRRRVQNCGQGKRANIPVEIVVRGSDGRVVKARPTGEFAKSPVATCVIRNIRMTRFPRFREKTLTINHRFPVN